MRDQDSQATNINPSTLPSSAYAQDSEHAQRQLHRRWLLECIECYKCTEMPKHGEWATAGVRGRPRKVLSIKAKSEVDSSYLNQVLLLPVTKCSKTVHETRYKQT
jgi:hypothetical protein